MLRGADGRLGFVSYDIHFMKLRRSVASSMEIRGDDFGPIDTVEAVRARLDAIFPGGIKWLDATEGRMIAIEWARWSLLPTKGDESSIVWVTLETSYRVSSDERYALAQQVADATGWTAIDDQGGAKRRVIAPRIMAADRSGTE